jgi:hypothetical protein
MGPHQRTVESARSADRSAISRAQKMVKKSQEFERMTELQQEDALSNIKGAVLEKRYLP